MPHWLKHYLKKYFLYYKVRSRFSSKENERQRSIVETYVTARSQQQLLSIRNVGFKNFSQFEEDGILLYIISMIENIRPVFLEFGSDDGINSNSANLYFNHEWNGLFIDANSKAIDRGRYFFKKYGNGKDKQPVFIESMITRDNINELIQQGGLSGEIGMMSIDIDGNDYWIWEAITCIDPAIVIIETHNEFGLNDIVVPYNADYVYPGLHPDYHGASPVAMNNLARSRGYRLVAANELGFNFIFVKNNLAPELQEVTVESVLQHPSNKEAQQRFEAIKDWEYIHEREP
jgi:hypothetical protein